MSLAPDFIPAHINLAGLLQNEGCVEDAQWHRDQAYRRQCVYLIPSPHGAKRTVLWTGALRHYDTANMTAAWKLDEEKHFLSDPEDVPGAQTMQVVREIGRRLDLDWCGVEFSVLPDGRLLLFEANATMLMHPEKEDDERPRHKNSFIQKIFDAFARLLDRVCAERPCYQRDGPGMASSRTVHRLLTNFLLTKWKLARFADV